MRLRHMRSRAGSRPELCASRGADRRAGRRLPSSLHWGAARNHHEWAARRHARFAHARAHGSPLWHWADRTAAWRNHHCGQPAGARSRRPRGQGRGERSFDAGAPFFVWTEVPAWQAVPIPSDVRSFADLEAFVPKAAASAGLDVRKPLPFLLRDHCDLIEFHVLNRIDDQPHDREKHKTIQAVFELAHPEGVMVGFYSPGERGVFTPMDSTIHIHFQSTDNRMSGHVQKLQLAETMSLAFPSR